MNMWRQNSAIRQHIDLFNGKKRSHVRDWSYMKENDEIGFSDKRFGKKIKMKLKIDANDLCRLTRVDNCWNLLDISENPLLGYWGSRDNHAIRVDRANNGDRINQENLGFHKESHTLDVFPAFRSYYMFRGTDDTSTSTDRRR